jgi:small subunit ribosomal protein S20
MGALVYKPRQMWRPLAALMLFMCLSRTHGEPALQRNREASMANTSSAKKATRKLERRTAVNKVRRSRMRGYVRKVEEAIAAGDKATAQAALVAAQPELMRAATKGVLHRNTASRKVSRLARRVKALPA